jgi:hypothetical protein
MNTSIATHAIADQRLTHRLPNRPIRPKRIAWYRRLLLDRPAASTGYPTDNLDRSLRLRLVR